MMPSQVWIPEPAVATVPTLADFAERWLREQAPGWKRSHARTVREGLAFWILPSLGAWTLDGIGRGDLLGLRAWMHGHARRPSPARINKMMGILVAVLREGAVRHGYPDPTTGMKALVVPESVIQPFSLVEVERILSYLEAPWSDYFAVRFFTGLRTGEVDGLSWQDVDLAAGRLTIQRAWVDGDWETPKSRAGYRTVVLVSRAREALVRQYERTGARQELVFCSARGTPVNRRNVTRRVWYPALDALRLDRRRAYQTRHTYATLMLAAGENVEFIRQQMGHRDARVLFSRYARYVPDLTRRDGSAMEALLSLSAMAPEGHGA